MARTTSEKQHQIADLYDNLADHMLRERGFFRGPALDYHQTKAVARDLKTLEERWRRRAEDSEAEGC